MSSFQIFVPCQLWTINHERRMHRSERARRVADIRRDAANCALARGPLTAFTTAVTVEFLPYQKTGKGSGRVADTANHLPPCKAVLDGLVDIGLIPDDSPQYVVSQTFYPPEKRAGLEGISILIKQYQA